MNIALERIAENKRTRCPHLSLTSCNISFLPTEIAQLTWLQSLDLSYNWVSDISVLQHLTDLQSLDLSDNWIGDVSVLQHLTWLSTLHLSYNPISDFSVLQRLTGLTTLSINGNNINEGSVLQHLTGLQSLDLSDNDISDISVLQHLTGLQSLDLSDNNISDVSILQQLTELITLNLSDNSINDFSVLRHLTGLTTLSLSGSKLTDFSVLQHLTGLTTLHLIRNQISDVSGLQHLAGLTTLDLTRNQISDVSILQHLTRLQYLDLSDNPIGDVSVLRHLTELTTLHLSGNKVSDVSILQHLTGLTTLSLSGNKISDFSVLRHLTGLTTLSLSGSKLTDFSVLQHLTGLTTLHLTKNQISDVSSFQHLTGLTTLELTRNQISDISGLRHLIGLTTLDLSDNQISDVSDLQHLTGLTTLYLSDNWINNVSVLRHLTKLTRLDLSYNQLIELEQVRDLTQLPNLVSLELLENPIQGIPKELFDSSYNCVDDLRDYFKDLDKSNGVRNNEIKMVLIGNGRVGKTCLNKRLVYDTFDPDERSTHAIQITEWILPVDLRSEKGLEEIVVNVWDFGGQDIYHATHRLFMQTEALFLLAWDADSEQREFTPETTPAGDTIQYPNYPLPYWLSYAKSLGRNSPVIVVQTKINLPGHRRKLPPNSNELEERFLIISGFEHVDSRTSTGFTSLRGAIQEEALNVLDRTKAQLPRNWYEVRTAIKETARSNRQMELHEYRKLCVKHGLEGTSPDTVLTYLHNTGLVFYKKGLFYDQIILDQKWAIDAVYTLFNREKIFYKLVKRGGDGKFTLRDLEEVWQEYSTEEKQLFISFMKSCEICYEVTDERNHQLLPTQQEYLAPALLSEHKPPLVTTIWKGNAGLFLQLQHEFLHFGVMQSFIVRMGKQQKVSLYSIWRNGVHIAFDHANALIEAFPAQNMIQIRVDAPEHKTLLERIRNEFRQIQGYERGGQEWVSLNGADYVSLGELQDKRRNDHKHITSREGNEFEVNNFTLFLQLDEEITFKEKPLKMEPLSLAENKPKTKDMSTENLPVKLFISYSHKDEKVKMRFDEALEVLKNLGKVDVWQDRLLLAGEEFEKSIFENIRKADIVCLLISPSFMASKYCFTKEMREALSKYEAGNGVVVPIIIKDTPLWHEFAIGKFNAVPTDGKPISAWSKKDAAWADVIRKINALVDAIRAKT